MERLTDIKLNEDMDIEISDGDLVLDHTLKNYARIAIQTSDDWWGNQYGQQVGSGIYEIFKKGKIGESELRLLKQEAEKSLQGIKHYTDGISCQIDRVENRVIIAVSINTKGNKELWKFPQ